MAMTANQLDIIKAIAHNDMPRARRAARAAIVEDGSKKNYAALRELEKLLDPTMNPDLMKLPYQVEGLIEVENPIETFSMSRYWISNRESKLFDEISTMRKVYYKLAELGIKRANSVLLYGVSGTGKTTFGRYVAASFDLPFYYINFSNLIDSHLGSTSKNVARVFDYVRCEPCVLMLDEVDTIARRRGSSDGGADAEINRITVTIMQEFDRLMNHQIVIGATNRLDVIDDALIRRFSRLHEVIPPKSAYEAASVMRVLFDDTGITYNDSDLITFCDEHIGEPQSWFIGKAIDHIISTVEKEVVK